MALKVILRNQHVNMWIGFKSLRRGNTQWWAIMTTIWKFRFCKRMEPLTSWEFIIFLRKDLH